MLRLHYHPNSTFSRRVRIVILEKGLEAEVEFVRVKMEERQHRSDEFNLLNPYGRVPVLQTDAGNLYESNAIMQYLELRFPKPALQPESPFDRARMLMLIGNCDRHYADPVTPQLFARRFLPQKRWDQAGLSTLQKGISQHYNILNQTLGQNKFLLGSDFSLADIAYVPFLYFADLLELALPENLAAWSNRLTERPSVQSSIPEK